MEAEPPKRKRRWYQFSMRTLFILMTMLAVPLGYVGWQAKIVRERNATRERLLEIAKRGELTGYGVIDTSSYFAGGSHSGKDWIFTHANLNTRISWLREQLGDRPAWGVLLSGANETEFKDIASEFPEAQVISIVERDGQLSYMSRGPETEFPEAQVMVINQEKGKISYKSRGAKYGS